MKIDKKFGKIAIETAEARAKELGVEFNSGSIENFRKMMKKTAELHPFKEGELTFDDHGVSELITRYLVVAKNNLAEKSEEVRAAVSPDQFALAAQDYLFAIAMEELGYPQFTSQYNFFGVRETAADIAKMKPDAKASSETYFNNQRRKDAKDLSERVSSLISATSSNDQDFDSFAELYGEYKALSQRQANHGAIWRFFHGKENEERTQMLASMREALEKSLFVKTRGEFDMTKEPSDVYRRGESIVAANNAHEALKERDVNPAKFFGYEEYEKNPELFAAWEAKQNEPSLSDQLTKTFSEPTTDVSAKVPEPPQKTAQVKGIE